MKKIILIIITMLFASTIINAMAVRESADTNFSNTDNVMNEFDNMIKSVRGEAGCICTMEYAPVCGEINGKENTYGNACGLKCAGAIFLHEGGCEENVVKKKEVSVNPIVCTMDAKQCSDGSYVGREGPDCKFKACPQEKKKDLCACTKIYKPVCAQPPMPKCEGGMMCAQVMPDSKTYSNECVMKCASALFLYEGGCKKDNVLKNQEKEFKGNTVFKINDGKVELQGQGVLHNGQLTSVDLNSEERLEVESSVDGSEHKVSFISGNEVVKINFKDNDKDIEIVDGELRIGKNNNVKIKPAEAKEKAKKIASADIVLSMEIKVEDNGEVNYLIKSQKKLKFLGLIDFNLDSEVKIDVVTGRVIDINEPWYSFLVF